MSLKQLVNQRIMNEVIRAVRKKGEWKVLVVDQLGMRIISSCCKMHEIANEGITIVEDINKKREPLPNLEAIYLISPSEASIRLFQQDFISPRLALYKGAHLFFTETCPDTLFSQICKQQCSKFILTCKEINIAFLPYESQVVSLDSQDAFQVYFNHRALKQDEATRLERMAEQISTLCATLGEYPNIRYRSDFERNLEFAQMIHERLNAYKADDPTMGEGPEKARSQMLILDRGFDLTSPLLHELTFQAMAYDLLNIENDVYKFEQLNGNDVREKEVLLDENDEIWAKLRHQHIAVVSQNIPKEFKKLMESKKMAPNQTSLKDLSKMIKLMPQHQKEISKHATHLRLADDCMKEFQRHVDKLCAVEQDLATGVDGSGEKIKDPSAKIVPILFNNAFEIEDKIRVILLLILSKTGITKDNLDRLIHHASIPTQDVSVITNAAQYGVPILTDGNRPKKAYTIPRKQRITEHTYQMSRWTPVVKDIMEDAIDDKLDLKHFPFLLGRQVATGIGRPTPTSQRYGHWHKEKNASFTKQVPRLIIFIVGGMTYSEMRCAYEVTEESRSAWEVIIASDHILTPRQFLKDCRSLEVV